MTGNHETWKLHAFCIGSQLKKSVARSKSIQWRGGCITRSMNSRRKALPQWVQSRLHIGRLRIFHFQPYLKVSDWLFVLVQSVSQHSIPLPIHAHKKWLEQMYSYWSWPSHNVSRFNSELFMTHLGRSISSQTPNRHKDAVLEKRAGRSTLHCSTSNSAVTPRSAQEIFEDKF